MIFEAMQRRRQGRDPPCVSRAIPQRFLPAYQCQSIINQGANQPINCLQLHPHGRFLLSGGSDGNVVLYDAQSSCSHEPLPQKNNPGPRWRNVHQIKATARSGLDHAHVEDCGWYHADAGLFTTSSRSEIKIWDTSRFAPVVSLQSPSGRECMSMAAGTASSDVIVCLEEGGMQMLDITAGKFTMDFRGHRDTVMCAAWHPTDKKYFC